MSKYTEAQARAAVKYQKAHTETITIRVRKGIKGEWQAAADKNGDSLSHFIIETMNARVARESAQEAAALGEAIKTFVKAHVRAYTVTYRVAEQFPSGTVKTSPTDAQWATLASSEDEARVAFFRFVKEQMQTEVAFEDATRIGMKRDDGVIEICEIVSVE